MTNSILYYPHIEIQNELWLKTSLLLWDTVYRIVPSTYTPKDSDSVKIAADQGLVRPVTLEKEDLSTICSEYVDFIRRLPFLPAGLDEIQTDRLHKEKIDSLLYPVLEKLSRDVDPEGFLELPSDFSRGYMMYLAKAVSGRRGLATATDNRYSWTISPYFTERANFDEYVHDVDSPAFHASLIFNDILPAGLENIAMSDIINFVHKRRDEREYLRISLNQLGKEISACQSPSHAVELKFKYIADLNKAKEDFRASMDFLNKDDVHSLLTYGIPVTATVFGALGLAGNPFDIVKIGASVFVGAIAAFADYKKIKFENRKDSQISYLVDIDKNLSSGGTYRYSRTFEEFMND